MRARAQASAASDTAGIIRRLYLPTVHSYGGRSASVLHPTDTFFTPLILHVREIGFFIIYCLVF